MMGWWTPEKRTKLKKCSEFHDPTCEQPLTDGCCAVIPCTYCLRWVPYTGAEQNAVTDGTWMGTIAGVSFNAYWEVGYESGVCEFVVTLAGVEIYRQDCYGGQSCRDSSDHVETSINGITGTLYWTKVLHRPLEYVIDADSYCHKHFCGTCECTCSTLCATLTLPSCCTVTFQLTDVSYPCDGPSWTATPSCDGTPYPIELHLIDGGSYGCSLGGTFNGTALDEVDLPTCVDWTVTFLLYDGTTLTVACDDCNCQTIPACDVGCCWPYVVTAQYPCGYPLPVDFEITAPGCSFDGFTGQFGNSGTGDRGSCGVCVTGSPPVYLGVPVGSLKVPAPGLGYCLTTPCGVSVYVYLECSDASSSTYGLDSCCGKLRLWVGTSERMVGWEGTAPTGGSASLYWLEIQASSCSCSVTPGGGFSAIFEVTLVSDCATLYTSGPCIGEPTCCVIICPGFTLTI